MADVWVGSETGILKGIDLTKKTSENYGDLTNLSKNDEVYRMCWFNANEENKILLATRSGIVKTFDVPQKCYIDEQQCFTLEDGAITGLAVLNNTAFACCENGFIKMMTDSDDKPLDIRVGSNIARMRQNPHVECQVATGGDENCLKLWDLTKPEEPLFKAKNVRHDQLDLRVPVFVKDMAFLSTASSLPNIIVGTAYHQIRLYDSKKQKRPVMDINFRDSPIMCISLANHERCVVVGNTHGDMASLDLRNAGKELGSFKSFAGCINDIVCHACEPFVASCGLDRFLRIHNLDTRQLIDKIYLKSRLKSLLFSKAYKKETSEQVEEKSSKLKRKQDDEKRESESSDDEEVWNEMDVIEDKKTKSKTRKKEK